MPKPAKPRLRILLGAEIAIGPGKADLLEAIARSGSISAAGRELGMSYRRAWNLVEVMNRSFRAPLVETLTGGAGGGGARGQPQLAHEARAAKPRFEAGQRGRPRRERHRAQAGRVRRVIDE